MLSSTGGVDDQIGALFPRAPIMAQQRLERQSDPAVLAIQRVLEAERASEEKLRDCRQRAQALTAAGRDRAQKIARRADARISKLQASYLRRIEQSIGALARPPAPIAEVDERPGDMAALAQAARRVAERLTSGEDEPLC